MDTHFVILCQKNKNKMLLSALTPHPAQKITVTLKSVVVSLYLQTMNSTKDTNWVSSDPD